MPKYHIFISGSDATNLFGFRLYAEELSEAIRVARALAMAVIFSRHYNDFYVSETAPDGGSGKTLATVMVRDGNVTVTYRWSTTGEE